MPKNPTFALMTTSGGSITSCDFAIVDSTSCDCQLICLGSGARVPSSHNTCSPLDTFHMPGPGCTPVTNTVSSSGTVVVDGGASCADAWVTYNNVSTPASETTRISLHLFESRWKCIDLFTRRASTITSSRR